MEFVNASGLEAAWLVRQVKPPATALIVLAKGTFQLRPGDAAALADEQLPLTGDEFEGDDAARPLRYAFDFAPYKPRADVLVVGTCHAPDGVPAPAVNVSLRVGSLAKSLWVYGDRYWTEERQHTDPEPFASLPVSWENAYGGPGFDRNPSGKGNTAIVRADGSIVRPVPNIESATRPMRTSADQVEPASLGPIPDTWPQRLRKFGTFDARSIKERWPAYARDFDWGFFNVAPEDQQVDGYLRGDEAFAVDNLHPQVPSYRGRLPGVRVRAFLDEYARDDLREIAMRLDTLWLDMDAEQMVLVWRGHATVASEQLEDVLHLLVAAEPTSQEPKRTLADYGLILSEALTRRAADDGELDDDDDEDEDEEEDEGEAEDADADTEAEPEIEADLPGVGAGPVDLKASEAPPGPGQEASEESQDAADDAADDEAILTEARVKELIAGRRSLAGCDLSFMELFDLDLSGLDLREAILEATTLAESDLSGADLRGATLAGANLHGARCVGANFAEADLTGAWLVQADLTDANLTGADLTKTQLRAAVLRRVKAAEAVFADADLSDAVAEGADLTACDLCGTRLHRTNLAGANLADAALEGAWGNGVTAPNAILDRVRGARAILYEADFRGATGEETVWEGADLSAANFAGASLPRAAFSAACLRDTVFDAATLTEARFDEADLRRAHMVRCNLYEASLEKANLTDANLTESNLFGATVMDADVQRTTLVGANLRRIKTREETT